MWKSMFLLFMVSLFISTSFGTLQEDIAMEIDNKTDTKKSLSRRKRYLVFPEGSNLQLVYCLTIPSVGMGQIFTLGATAALAWQLPHDPMAPFKRPAEVLHRIDKNGDHSSGGWDVKKDKATSVLKSTTLNNGYSTLNSLFKQTIYNTINKGWTPKESYSSLGGKKQSYKTLRGSNRDGYDNRQPIRQYRDKFEAVKSYVDPVYHRVYKRTRRELYAKVENFFTALRKDGKACLLKAICEVSGESKSGKGTFMEEIIKVIFKTKPMPDHPDEDIYDKTASSAKNCTQQYPSCTHSVWQSIF